MKLAQHITRIIDLFYVKPLRRLIPVQMFRYAACGGGNLVLNWVLYFLIFHFVVCERFIDLKVVMVSPHVSTLIIVTPLTFLSGFWLQSRISFKGSPLRESKQVFRYLLSFAGSLAINYAGIKLFVEVCGIYPTPSQMLASLITVVFSYCMQKYYTFRGSCSE